MVSPCRNSNNSSDASDMNHCHVVTKNTPCDHSNGSSSTVSMPPTLDSSGDAIAGPGDAIAGPVEPKKASKQRQQQQPNSSHNQQQQHSTSPDTPKARRGVSRSVFLRFILVASLLAAAGICASLAYVSLSRAEVDTAEYSYHSISISALNNAKAIARRQFQAAELTASIASWANPEADDWPLIRVPGYMDMTSKVANLTSSTTQALSILVDPSQVEEFEAHVQQLYREEGRPAEAGMSDFGFGIWKPDANSTFPDGRVHDTTGENNWGGVREELPVVTLHNRPVSSSLMYNAYSEEDRGIHLDSMYDCTERHNDTATTPACAVVTDMLELKLVAGPAGLLFLPVYPANDPTKFVGFASTSIVWALVLTNIVPNSVNGLVCIVSTETTSWTFEIQEGEPVLVGPGDQHDLKYDHYGKSVILNDIVTGARTSAVYQLTVYPSETMFTEYQSNSPLAVALSFLGVIFVCTLLFFMYDFLMRHEAHQRTLVLNMKRRFVRFISHEIRTPLNTVAVGLELLECELRKGMAELKEDPTKETCGFSADDIDFLHNVSVEVKENAGIAVSILNDLLNYDKLESGKLSLETRRVNMWELIERTVHQFGIQATNKGIKLQLTFGSSTEVVGKTAAGDVLMAQTHTSEGTSLSDVECPAKAPMNLESGTVHVVGDEVRLCQVMRNLISNALKFTPHNGTINVNVTHRLNGLADAAPMAIAGEIVDDDQRQGSLIISVTDTGVGLTKEQLSLLFTEGLQFDANKLQHGGGSGLGLSIAKGIVEMHQGTIRAESDGLGHGSSFVVELPLYETATKNYNSDDSEDSTNRETTQSLATYDCDASSFDHNIRSPSPPSSKRILVVEDSFSSRKMMIRLFEREGHTCVPAENGEEAVRVVTENLQQAVGTETSDRDCPFDTILMDFEMPILNGPNATRQIRALGFTGTIIGVTGNVLSEDVEHFKESGANEVLAKPISLDLVQKHWDRFSRRKL